MSKTKVGSVNAGSPEGIVRIGALAAAGQFALAVKELEEEHGVAVENLSVRVAESRWNAHGERFGFKRRRGQSRGNAPLVLTDIETY